MIHMTNETENPAVDPYAPQRFTLEITFSPGRGWEAVFDTADPALSTSGQGFTADNPALLLAAVTRALRPLHRTPWQVFSTAHGARAIEALRWFAAYMYREAASAQASYETVSADPELAARQDASMMTTMGLFHSASLFADAAARADRAREAYEALDGDREYAFETFDMTHGYVLKNALMVLAEHVREGKDPVRDLAVADAASAARHGYELLAGELDGEEPPLDAGFQE
jgi:hypothetical protein